MTVPSPRANRKARIEIIPLIDIIFFLLATFVMVSLSMVKNKGIPVNLPVAATGSPQDRKDYAVITVTKDGELFFDKEPLKLEQLRARLRQLQAEQTDPKVFINGDEKAYFGQAVAVLDEIRRLGIAKVAIETKPKAEN
jgi:biopolymer transport protein ExbD